MSQSVRTGPFEDFLYYEKMYWELGDEVAQLIAKANGEEKLKVYETHRRGTDLGPMSVAKLNRLTVYLSERKTAFDFYTGLKGKEAVKTGLEALGVDTTTQTQPAAPQEAKSPSPIVPKPNITAPKPLPYEGPHNRGAVPQKKAGRPRRLFTRQETVKANFLYFTNQRTITDVAKIMGASPPTVDRYLFKTKAEYERVSDEWQQNKLDDRDLIEGVDGKSV